MTIEQEFRQNVTRIADALERLAPREAVKSDAIQGDAFVWNADDYFGASLAEFTNILEKYSYKLICCNSHTGSNAFFIKNNFTELFKEVPREIEEIYVPPHYQLYERYGHPQSIKTIELIFEELEKM